MKKICYIVSDAFSFNILCVEQLEELAKQEGVHLTLVSGGSVEDIQLIKGKQFGDFIQMPLQRRPSLVKDVIALLCLIKLFIFNRFDLVIYSTPKALLLSSIASFVTFQKNRIAIIRGRVYENSKGLKRTIFSLFDKLSCKLSTKVIFISKSLATNYVKEKLISKEKAKVLGHGSSKGVNLGAFAPSSLDKRQYLKQSLGINSTFVITTVGRLCKDKGAVELLELIQSLECYKARLSFIIVGRVEDEYGELIVNYAAKSEGYVNYFEHSHDVSSFFKISDLHLFLTHREGFGNVALEAAATGIPTFAFDVVGVKDSVKHGVSGKLFRFLDVRAIVNEIASHIENTSPPFNKEKCRQWASKNFEQSTVVKNYVKYYLDSLKGF